VYLALAVVMYGSIFAALGAACTDFKEAQSLITPVMLVVVLPMFAWMQIAQEPNSTFATVLSFVPTATPMVMIARQAVPPGVPLWQPLAGVAVVLVTTIACVFV